MSRYLVVVKGKTVGRERRNGMNEWKPSRLLLLLWILEQVFAELWLVSFTSDFLVSRVLPTQIFSVSFSPLFLLVLPFSAFCAWMTKSQKLFLFFIWFIGLGEYISLYAIKSLKLPWSKFKNDVKLNPLIRYKNLTTHI